MANAVGGVDIATLGLRLQGGQMVNESKRAEASLTNLGKAGKGVQRILVDLGIAMSAGLAFQRLIRETLDFETALAGVAKTVDLPESQIAALGERFREMSSEIPIATNELLGLAESAGQLGIATDNIEGFVRVMADLGVATNLTSEEAATSLARLANVMQTPQTEFDRMGATIVDLGNNFATTEKEIVEFAQRLAGAGQIAGLTEADVFAISAALSSVGVEAEAGGTAVQQVLIDITTAVSSGGSQLERFAAIAGMSAREFAEAWRSDAGEAFTLFIEGLGAAGSDATNLLSGLGLEGARLTRSFLSLANAGDLMRRSLDKSTEAWEENSALTKEAERFYETLANQIKVARNQLVNWAADVGERYFAPAIQYIIDNGRLATDVVITLAFAFGAARLAGAIKAVAGAITSSAIPAFIALLGSVKNLRDMITLLQISIGPGGWLIVGITALSTALFFWRRSQADVVEETGRVNRILEEKREQLKKTSVAALEAARSQLMLNIARAKERDTPLNNSQIEVLHAEALLLRDINEELLRRKNSIDGITVTVSRTGGGEEERRGAAARQLEEEIARVRELNEVIGGSQKAIDLINLKYEERIQLLKNAEEFSGAELEQMNALTRQLFEARRATAELEEAERNREDSDAITKNIDALEREVEAARGLYDAQLEGAEAVKAFRIALAGENAVLAFGGKLTEEQAAAVRALAEEKERLAIATEALTDEQRREAEEAKRLTGLYEEAARGIQRALASGFMSIQTEGLEGFESMADAILRTFQGLASEIAALMTAKALGLDKLLEKIRTGGKLTGTESSIGAGIAGIGAGLGTGDPLAGGAIGAASGFAIGGPVGAIVGGVAGIASGLFEQGRRMEMARDRWAESMEDFRDLFEPGSAMDRGMERLNDMFQGLAAQAAEMSGISVGGLVDPEDARAFIERARDLPRNGITESFKNYADALEEILALYDKNAEALREQVELEEARLNEDLRVRLLRAKGQDEEADALERELRQQRELEAAIEAKYDKETLALLKQVHAAEDLAAAAEDTKNAIDSVTNALNSPSGLNLRLMEYQASLIEATRSGITPRPVRPTDAPSTEPRRVVVVENLSVQVVESSDARRTAREVIDEFRRITGTGEENPLEAANVR